MDITWHLLVWFFQHDHISASSSAGRGLHLTRGGCSEHLWICSMAYVAGYRLSHRSDCQGSDRTCQCKQIGHQFLKLLQFWPTDRSCHCLRRMAPSWKSSLQTCTQVTRYPESNHKSANQQEVLGLWSICWQLWRCTLALDDRILLNPSQLV